MVKKEHMLKQLEDYLRKQYAQADYPAIAAQWEDFSARKPFDGLRILEATPLFFNTTAKLVPLLAGGAELTISRLPGTISDSRCVSWMASLGMLFDEDGSGEYDLVSDCIGCHAGLTPRLGFAELTHSGLSYYAQCQLPCFNTDGGRIKHIEGALGTGDGLVRGMQHFGMDVVPEQRWVLFGFGKIGAGVGYRLKRMGAQVSVVEAPINRERVTQTSLGVFSFVDMHDVEAVVKAVSQATHVATATSVAGVISSQYPVEAFMQGQVLVNIGAEDEFGELFPKSSVLNDKVAINFALEEPTHLRYIETTFALQNAGLEWVLHHPKHQGIVAPPQELEESLLSSVRLHGRIAPELKMIGL